MSPMIFDYNIPNQKGTKTVKNILSAALLLTAVFSSSPAETIGSWSFDDSIDNTAKSAQLKAVRYGKIAFEEGLSGKALAISAKDPGAVIVENSAFMNGLKTFSVSFWTKLNGGKNNVLSVFVSKNGEEKEGWQIRTFRDYGFACFTMRSESGKAIDCFGGARIDDGNWHHVAAVYDGKLAVIYVDGVQGDVADVPDKIFPTEAPLAIGAKVARGKKTPYCFLDGSIDELKIFDHALSRAEVDKLANRDTLLRAKLTKMYIDYGIYSIPVHRGGGKYQPENTLESFDYAWSRKMVPEGDIRMTKDGVIVLLHDNDVKRTAPKAPKAIASKVVGELTLAQLKTLDVGEYMGKPGQRIPTLEEVFEVMSKDPSKFMYLDYKTLDLELLAKMVRKYGIEKQVIFTTNNYYLIQQWRKMLPESQTMIWMGGSEEMISRTVDELRRNNFKDVYIVHMHYKRKGDGFQLSEAFLHKMHNELKAYGIVLQVMPWGIEDGSVYERILQQGFESVGADYPDVVLPIYKKYFGPAGTPLSK